MSLVRALTLTTALFAASMAHAAPALWKVSDDDSSIYLFGSIHMLPYDLDWRTPALDEAIESADRVFFEADISMDAQVGLAGTVIGLGMNIDGTTIESYLDAEEIAELEAVVDDLNLPMVSLRPMKPWLASTTLSAAAITAEGYAPDQGVELQLMAEIPAEKRAYLETVEEQLRMFADLPEETQVGMLVQTIGELPATGEMLVGMVDAWVTGVPEGLEKFFLDASAGVPPDFNEQVIYARNARWAETITGLLAGSDDLLFVVGTGHLIGDRGVPELLAAQGLAVERVQ